MAGTIEFGADVAPRLDDTYQSPDVAFQRAEQRALSEQGAFFFSLNRYLFSAVRA